MAFFGLNYSQPSFKRNTYILDSNVFFLNLFDYSNSIKVTILQHGTSVLGSLCRFSPDVTHFALRIFSTGTGPIL